MKTKPQHLEQFWFRGHE